MGIRYRNDGNNFVQEIKYNGSNDVKVVLYNDNVVWSKILFIALESRYGESISALKPVKVDSGNLVDRSEPGNTTSTAIVPRAAPTARTSTGISTNGKGYYNDIITVTWSEPPTATGYIYRCYGLEALFYNASSATDESHYTGYLLLSSSSTGSGVQFKLNSRPSVDYNKIKIRANIGRYIQKQKGWYNLNEFYWMSVDGDSSGSYSTNFPTNIGSFDPEDVDPDCFDGSDFYNEAKLVCYVDDGMYWQYKDDYGQTHNYSYSVMNNEAYIDIDGKSISEASLGSVLYSKTFTFNDGASCIMDVTASFRVRAEYNSTDARVHIYAGDHSFTRSLYTGNYPPHWTFSYDSYDGVCIRWLESA